ncbi:MAG: ketol-acid reductoisomerase, partial [Halobacteriales archaeon]
REWINENQANRPSYNQLKQRDEEHLIEDVGEELRSLMTWADDE